MRSAPSAPVDPASFQPVAGDVVEAQVTRSVKKPHSWWKATIKAVRGEFYMISYSSCEVSRFAAPRERLISAGKLNSQPVASLTCFLCPLSVYVPIVCPLSE